MEALAYQISSSGMLVGMHGHVNHYDSRGAKRAAVDAAKELGYDSLKDLQLAGIRGIVSWQEYTYFPKCE